MIIIWRFRINTPEYYGKIIRCDTLYKYSTTDDNYLKTISVTLVCLVGDFRDQDNASAKYNNWSFVRLW